MRILTILSAFLLAVSAGGALVGARLLGDRERPGFEYMPDMVS